MDMNISSFLSSTTGTTLLWTFIESLGYKFIYCVLQIIFFNYLPSSLYVQQGIIFGLVYMAVTIFNTGFDQFLLYLFKHQGFSQIKFSQLIKRCIQHIIYTCGIIFLSAAITYNYYTTRFLLSSYLFIILIGLVIVEIIKKNSKVLMYITLHNKEVTWIELSGLVVYSCIISYKIFYSTIEIQDFFLYLLLVNGISLIFFFIYIGIYHKHLNDSETATGSFKPSHLLYKIYLIQLAKLFLSPHVVTPLFASTVSNATAQSFFFMSAILQTAEFITIKLSTISGSTFFVYSSLSSMNLYNMFIKKLLVIYSIIISISILILSYFIEWNMQSLSFIILYIFTLLIDNLLIVYEKYAIIENKLTFYSFAYTSICLLAWAFIYITHSKYILYNMLILATLKSIFYLFFTQSKKCNRD